MRKALRKFNPLDLLQSADKKIDTQLRQRLADGSIRLLKLSWLANAPSIDERPPIELTSEIGDDEQSSVTVVAPPSRSIANEAPSSVDAYSCVASARAPHVGASSVLSTRGSKVSAMAGTERPENECCESTGGEETVPPLLHARAGAC